MSKLKAVFLACVLGTVAMTSCGSVAEPYETADIPAAIVTKRLTSAVSETEPPETSPPETEPPESVPDETTEEVTTTPAETHAPLHTTAPHITTTTKATTAATKKSSTTRKTTTSTTTTTTTTATTTTAAETKPAETVPDKTGGGFLQKLIKDFSERSDRSDRVRLPVKLKEKLLRDRRFSAADFPEYVYSNRKLKNALDSIDEICREYGGRISFAYRNTDTGASCFYREDTYYGCCSTVKAPYCAALLRTKPDLSEKLTVTELWGGDDGYISRNGTGRTYTVRDLIRYTIMRSDNSAYLTLVNRFGRKIFNDMNSSLGGDTYLMPDWDIFPECTAKQLLDEYVYIYGQGRKKPLIGWLTRLMQKTDVESQITAQLEEKYAVSHKYGSDRLQVCYHDCAIVYADSPFVLVILTRQEPETKGSDKVFRKLAKQFDIVNEQIVKFDSD